MRPGCRQESLGSLGCALELAGISWGGPSVRPWSLETALVVVWLVRGRWVHCCAPWGSSGSFAVAGLIRVRYGGRRARPGALGSLVFAPLGLSGSSGVS